MVQIQLGLWPMLYVFLSISICTYSPFTFWWLFPLGHMKILTHGFLGFFNLYTISKFIFKITYYFPEDSDQQMFKQLFCEKNTMMNINGPCPYETYSFIRFWKAHITLVNYRVGFSKIIYTYLLVIFTSWSFTTHYFYNYSHR